MSGSRDNDRMKSKREQARQSRNDADSCCVAVLKAAGTTALVIVAARLVLRRG